MAPAPPKDDKPLSFTVRGERFVLGSDFVHPGGEQASDQGVWRPCPALPCSCDPPFTLPPAARCCASTLGRISLSCSRAAPAATRTARRPGRCCSPIASGRRRQQTAARRTRQLRPQRSLAPFKWTSPSRCCSRWAGWGFQRCVEAASGESALELAPRALTLPFPPGWESMVLVRQPLPPRTAAGLAAEPGILRGLGAPPCGRHAALFPRRVGGAGDQGQVVSAGSCASCCVPCALGSCWRCCCGCALAPGAQR